MSICIFNCNSRHKLILYEDTLRKLLGDFKLMTKIRKSIKKNGLKMTLHFGITHVIERRFYKINIASAKDFFSRLNNIYLHPRTCLINELINFEGTKNEMKREFYACSKQLKSKAKSLSLRYPSNFALNSMGTYMVYNITRIVKPKIVVETGVANGVSTFYILKALKNGSGKLISSYISPDVRSLISDAERLNCDLRVLGRKRRRDFIENISKIGKVDFFLHDGDHIYNWQYMEYKIIFPLLTTAKIYLEHDIISSNSFLDCIKDKSLNKFCAINKGSRISVIKMRIYNYGV